MKIGNLFDLLTDARDILEFFDGCHNREQLVSRLERLKRQGSDELMDCIEGLRVTLDRTFEDTLEMSASLDEREEESGDHDLDKELEDLVGNLDKDLVEKADGPAQEPTANDQNPKQEPPAADLKNDTTSSA